MAPLPSHSLKGQTGGEHGHDVEQMRVGSG